MKLVYVAGGCLVVAQILGIYALKSRKADLVFTFFMVILLLAAVALGVWALYRRFG